LIEAEHLEGLLCPAEILCLAGAEEAQIAGSFMKMEATDHLKIIILLTQGKDMDFRTRNSWIHESQMTICVIGNLEIIMMLGHGKDLNHEGIIGLLTNAIILPKRGGVLEVLAADLLMVILLLMVDGEMRLGKVPMIELVLIPPMGIGLSTVG
jgi:hypothetical protein